MVKNVAYYRDKAPETKARTLIYLSQRIPINWRNKSDNIFRSTLILGLLKCRQFYHNDCRPFMNSSEPDLIYSSPQQHVKDFCFDAQVVEVFPDMIKRSIPGYNTIIDTIGALSKKFAQDNSTIYDLGCSLGAATIAMRRQISAQNCHIVSIDNSPAMVERCQMHVNAFKSTIPCDVIADAILSYELENASVIVLNFTLQFIPVADRLALLQRIRKGMCAGGILLLSEKIAGATPQQDATLVAMHHAFKRTNGYSELEVSQKRAALEKVLLPETLATHQQRLQEAGFSRSDLWFQYFNFVSIVAYA